MSDFRQELREIRQANNRVAWLLSSYIDNYSRSITPEMMADSCAENHSTQELFYRMLLAQLCGLDYESSEDDRKIYEKYWVNAVHRRDAEAYRRDPYYSSIHIPNAKCGRWELGMDTYAPFETFIWRDLTLGGDTSEIPHAGYFDEEFTFPCVRQDGREWMAVKPNEVETMRLAIAAAYGKVVTLGLGLGYFTYMASEKDDVESITVIEHDKDVIKLFRQFILPQFPHKEKISIVCCDAFDFVTHTLPHKDFEFVFADLWHDASDGLGMYLKLKRHEYLAPQGRFMYWIEESLLSRARWQLFDAVLATSDSREKALRLLSDDFIRSLASGIRVQGHR